MLSMQQWRYVFLGAGVLALGLEVAVAAPGGRHTHGGIAYVVTDRATCDTLAQGMLLLVDLELTGGSITWQGDSLYIAAGTTGFIELDQTHPGVIPAGFLWLELCGDTLLQSVASGVFLHALPPPGARLPFALPLAAAVKLDAERLGFPGRDVEVALYKRLEGAGEPGTVEAGGI